MSYESTKMPKVRKQREHPDTPTRHLKGKTYTMVIYCTTKENALHEQAGYAKLGYSYRIFPLTKYEQTHIGSGSASQYQDRLKFGFYKQPHLYGLFRQENKIEIAGINLTKEHWNNKFQQVLDNSM